MKCIMSLKTKTFDKGAAEMFTSEYDKEESLWNVMSEIPKIAMRKKQVSKDSKFQLQKIQFFAFYNE